MIIDLAIQVTPDQIHIQHPEKGMLLKLRNIAAYDPAKGAILSIGTDPRETTAAQETLFTAPFGPQGFADGLARPVMVYLVEKAQSRFYDNRWTHALNVMRDTIRLNLQIADYDTVPPDQRRAFEDAISPLWQTTLNGADLGANYRQAQTARRAYLYINLAVLAVLVLLLVGIGTLVAELVQPGDMTGMILSLILLYAAALVILNLGTVLSRLLWVLALRRRLAPAVLKAQLAADRRLQGSLAFVRGWLENLVTRQSLT